MAATARVFIDGEAGTTDLGIRERLLVLPDNLTLSFIHSVDG